MDTLQAIAENLKEGQAAKVKELTQAALDEGISPDDVLDNGLIAGKNVVGIVLKGAGFEVTDLGVNTPTQKFVEAAQNGAQIIGMSALLTTTMQHMQPVIDALEKAGLKGRVKTMIGGCIVTQEYADSIRADGYAPDAGSAVDKAKELMGLA